MFGKKKENEKVELGDMAKDVITGFEGIVTGRTQWLNSCERFIITPREKKDGKPIAGHWFDIQQVVLVEKGAYLKALGEHGVQDEVVDKPPGGPRDDPSNDRAGG